MLVCVQVIFRDFFGIRDEKVEVFAVLLCISQRMPVSRSGVVNKSRSPYASSLSCWKNGSVYLSKLRFFCCVFAGMDCKGFQLELYFLLLKRLMIDFGIG